MIPNYLVTTNDAGDTDYVLDTPVMYWSPRYENFIRIPSGYHSDGSTGALDIHSLSWWVHDKICNDPTFEDETPITAWMAASVLYDILRSEGRWIRARTWRYSTFFMGCTKARKNGWV